MPNRILKDSICVSQTIAELSWFQEVFFYRLIVSCDDFGRFYATPSVLRGRLFPLNNVTDKQVSETLDKLSSVGIIQIYTVDNVSYLQITTWDKHQNRRAKNSKFPGIENSNTALQQSNTTGIHMNTFEINCEQLQANVPEESRNRGIEESRNRGIEELHGASSEQKKEKELVEEIPLNDGTMFPVYQDQVDEWIRLYPAVNIEQQLRNMVGWCQSNKAKRKTSSGILRFITNWLKREQDQGGSRPPAKPTRQSQQDVPTEEDYLKGADPEMLRVIYGEV